MLSPVPTIIDGNALIEISPATATQKPFVIQAVANQSANLFEIQSGIGTNLLSVASNGATTFAASTAQIIAPTADVIGLKVNAGSATPAGVAVSAAGYLLDGTTKEWQLGNLPGSTVAGCLTLGNKTPSVSVWTMYSDNNSTQINAPSAGNIYLRLNNVIVGNFSTSAFTLSSGVKLVVPSANGSQNTFGTVSNADALADTIMGASAATQNVLQLQGFTGQSANFLTCRNQANTVVASIGASGGIIANNGLSAATNSGASVTFGTAFDLGLGRAAPGTIGVYGQTGAAAAGASAFALKFSPSGLIQGNAVAATANTSTGSRTGSATALFTTPAVHNLVLNQHVQTSNCTVATYNGDWITTSIPSTTTLNVITNTNTTDQCLSGLVTAIADEFIGGTPNQTSLITQAATYFAKPVIMTSGIQGPSGGTGTNIAASNLILTPGAGTGTGVPALVTKKFTLQGINGTTAQVFSTQQYPLPGVMYVATANGSLATPTTTGSLVGTGVGTVSLEGGLMTPGRVVRIKAYGTLTTSVAGPTLKIDFKVGSFVAATTGAVAPLSGVTGGDIDIETIITCRIYGGANVATLQGDGTFAQGNPTTFATSSYNMNLAAATSASLDLTATNTIDLFATWSANTAGNTITITSLTIEVLN